MSNRADATSRLDLIDHGIAVRRGACMSHIVATDPVDGSERIYLGINQGNDPSVSFLLVQLDPRTGKCRQFQAPSGCVAPWGMVMAPDRRILMTSIYGQVTAFDPHDDSMRVIAKADTWFWTIARADDGHYYLGSHPDAMLWRLDLAAESLEQVGSMDATQHYLRSLAPGGDGYLYGTIGLTAAGVIAYRLTDGSARQILPDREAVPNLHQLGRGGDGALYVQCFTGSVYRVGDGRAEPVDAETWPGFAPAKLMDGRPVKLLDTDEVQIGEGAQADVWPLEYEGNGTTIFHLAEGPGGCVYGSTLLPLCLLRYDPRTRTLASLGRASADNGEAYSFGHVDGKLYYATYPSGYLMCYDPARPWHPTPQWDDNPWQIRLGEGHCRPRAMVVDDQKRVWVGSHPEYGKSHGGLACYDTLSGTLQNNPVVIPNQSIASLASEPTGRILFGGTDITRGSGASSSTTEGRLFAWDVQARRVLWETAPFEGETAINNLLYRDGRLYGTTTPGGRYFIADAETGEVKTSRCTGFGNARDQSMNWAPDGNIYGITWMALFRFRPDGEVDELERHVNDGLARHYGGSVFHRGAAIIDGRIYFSCAARVLSMQLPLEPAAAVARAGAPGQ